MINKNKSFNFIIPVIINETFGVRIRYQVWWKKCTINSFLILGIRFTINNKSGEYRQYSSTASWWCLSCAKYIYQKFFFLCFIAKRFLSISREKFYLHHHPRQSNIINNLFIRQISHSSPSPVTMRGLLKRNFTLNVMEVDDSGRWNIVDSTHHGNAWSQIINLIFRCKWNFTQYFLV